MSSLKLTNFLNSDPPFGFWTKGVRRLLWGSKAGL